MNIVIGFDDSLLKQYEQRGSPAFFTIFFQHNGRAYPSEPWMDFGAIILGWWVMSTIKLINDEGPQELHFMDGPYALVVELARDHRTLKCSDTKDSVCWVVDFVTFVNEITMAANCVIRHLVKMNMHENDAMTLQRGLDLLAKARTSLSAG